MDTTEDTNVHTKYLLFAYKAKVVYSAIVKRFRNSQLAVATCTIRKYTYQHILSSTSGMLTVHVPVTILKFCILLFDRRLQLVIMLCCIASKYRCYSNVFLHTFTLSSNAIENYMSRKVMDWSSYLFRCMMNIRIIFVFEQQTASWINLQL